MSATPQRGRQPSNKPFTLAGRRYHYWIRTGKYDANNSVMLRVVVRAEFGYRSFCSIVGLQNREYWHDYPNFDPSATIAVTPSAIGVLIDYAHRFGWQPQNERRNFTIEVSNDLLLSPQAKDTSHAAGTLSRKKIDAPARLIALVRKFRDSRLANIAFESDNATLHFENGGYMTLLNGRRYIQSRFGDVLNEVPHPLVAVGIECIELINQREMHIWFANRRCMYFVIERFFPTGLIASLANGG